MKRLLQAIALLALLVGSCYLLPGAVDQMAEQQLAQVPRATGQGE